VLDVLDPRKSRDLSGLKQKRNKIIIEGTKETFDASNLLGALKVALSQSKKKTGSIRILLPLADVSVSSAISLPNEVTLIGQTDIKKGVCSRLVVDDSLKGCFLSLAGKTGALSNVHIVLSKKQNAKDPSIKIEKGKHLVIKECVITPPDGGFPGSAKLREGLVIQGTADITGCSFTGITLVFDKTSDGTITSSTINAVESKEKSDLERCGVSICSTSKQGIQVSESAVNGFNTGVLISSSGNTTSLHGTTIEALKCAIDLSSGNSEVYSCTLTAGTRAVKASSAASRCKMKHCKILGGSIGATLESGASIAMDTCSISGVGKLALRVDSKANLTMNTCTISGEPKNDQVDGVQIKDGTVTMSQDCKLKDLTGRGVICQGEGSKFTFSNISMERVNKGCIVASKQACIEGVQGTFVDNNDVVISLHHEGTKANLEDIKIKGGNVGLLIKKVKEVKIKNLSIEDTTDKGLEITDASVEIHKATLVKAGSQGILVRFKNKNLDVANEVHLKFATVRKSTDVGLRVVQEGDEKVLENASSQCIVDNSAFLESKVGVDADGARLKLRGCSFIFNKEKSITINRMNLRPSRREGNLSKEANLEIRWANYVEPQLPQGEEVSNDNEKLNACTLENNFFGAYDWEYSMYVSTMVERMRQARTQWRQQEEDGEEVKIARIIMSSIEHVTLLLQPIGALLLEELVDDPDLGMFATTFPLREDKQKTVFKMEQLFDSWKGLKKPAHFDKAIVALDMAFEKKHVTEDQYDEWFPKLEEMERKCYVESKYSRRRDYLFTTAKESPLTTWFFLDKESPDTEEGKRLRKEILEFLASNKPEKLNNTDYVNMSNFDSSWIAQWALDLLGMRFMKSSIPEDQFLRAAWGNMLLDAGKCERLVKEFKTISMPVIPQDDLLRWEAYDMMEKNGIKFNLEDYNRLFNGTPSLPQAVQDAARSFNGVGALPGLLRRQAEQEKSAEMLLATLSFVSDFAVNDLGINHTKVKNKNDTVLAVMHHHLYPDSTKPPVLYDNQKVGYETCQMCLVRKLQPWNELKLDACKRNHHYCRWCMKDSMSSAISRGCCPGRDENNNECGAKATRREMELAGVERDIIYSVMEDRIRDHFNSLDDWNPCDAPGCIGGRSNVKKKFYTCRLCTKMVTEDGGASDPTIPRRLLQGLDGTTVMRGEGVFRECYHCATRYEKGNACSTITCAQCKQQFNMTFGNEQMTHRFDEQGIGPQRYVPLKEGLLWKLGVFKDRKGKPLQLGQSLTEAQAAEVVRRAKLKLPEFDG